MRLPASYKNARPLLWFCAALALFLAAGVALSISRQRVLLMEELNGHIDREVSVIEAVITEDVMTYNYAGIKHYLSAYAARSRDISSIRVVGPKGVVLAQYSRSAPPRRTFTRIHEVQPGEPYTVKLEVVHDVDPLHRTLMAIVWRNVAASVLFAGAMAFFLWKLLRKTAFIPLENAVRELNKANDSLEERVAIRTFEWMRTNTELTREIAGREAAQQQLRESEAKFKSFAEQAIVGIYLIQDDRVRYTNPRFLEMFGYAPGELEPDIEFLNLIHPEDRQQLRERMELRLAGSIPSSNYQFRGVMKNGETIHLEVYGTVIEYGGRPAAIGTLLDITQRVTAEEELRKSEAKHRMVVENINEIIYSMTLAEGRLQGAVDFLGGNVQQLLGYPLDTFLRNPELWLSIIHRDDLPGLRKNTQRMVQDGVAVTRVYRVLHRDSTTYLWLEDRIVPRFGPGGGVIGYFGVARDITRRKQAEESLRDALNRAEEEKNKSEAIVSALGDGISIQDRDFRVLYQNERHREIVDGNHVGEFCYMAYQGNEEVCPGCPVAESFADGKVHISERSRMTGQGRIYAEVSASPLRGSAGEIIAGIELVRNITDRKKAEQDLLRASETQAIINGILQIPLDKASMEEVLRSALRIVLSSSWYASQSKGAIFLSDGSDDLRLAVEIGLSKGMHTACSRVVPGKCLCGRAAQTGTIQFAQHLDERHDITYPGMGPHGHYCVPVMASAQLLAVLSLCLEDGHPSDAYERDFLAAVANALAGIIQRKRMQEERENLILDLKTLLGTVSASRQEWQETFDSITDMISIHDEEYRIIKANKAFAGQFGLTPREIIGKHCYELFHNGTDPIAGCPHQKTLAQNVPVTEEVADPRTGRMFLISTFPFHSAESGRRGIVHVARDITEAKENETRLLMSERLASLGKMASGIAHEINNPLAAIAGCVDGMKRRLSRGDLDLELFDRYLGIMKEELTRSKNITTSMLSFVQAKDYQKGRVKLHVALLKSLEIIGYQGRLKKVNVVKELADSEPAVHGSEGELKQVFLIVLSNALDAMDDQGSLTLGTSLTDRTVTVTIADSGPGIAPENADRIFRPFFTTKAERGGTGLGLSIATRIIGAHSGRFTVASPPGSGAVVTIELPLWTPPGRDGLSPQQGSIA